MFYIDYINNINLYYLSKELLNEINHPRIIGALMKSRKLVTIAILLMFPISVYSSDASEIWSRMYKRSVKPELKLAVMTSMVKINDKGMIDLYEEIIAEDIVANLSNKKSVNEAKYFNDLAILVVNKLGQLKAVNSASFIYQVYLNSEESLVQAECLLALGNMRATEFLDDIAYVLHTKNQRPTKGAYTFTDIENESKVAFAAISALDRFKDIEGYSPVFFASIGWYNDRVTNYADKVLLTITPNPTEALIPILVDGDFKEKEKAISEVYECNAPAEDKIRSSRIALQQGHDNIADTIQKGMILTSLRKKAIITTWSNKSSEPEDVHYLLKSVREGTDLEERIYAIRALGINNSDEAISALTTVLQEYNERNVSDIGITYVDEDIIREIIITLGKCGNKNAEYALMEVLYSGYTDGIVRTAKKALENIL